MQRANIVQRNVQRQARDNTSKESAIVASFPFSRVHRFAPKIPLIRVISEGRARVTVAFGLVSTLSIRATDLIAYRSVMLFISSSSCIFFLNLNKSFIRF